jgi:hypothetical protein
MFERPNLSLNQEGIFRGTARSLVFQIDPNATLRYNKVNVLQLKVCLPVLNSQSAGDILDVFR